MKATMNELLCGLTLGFSNQKIQEVAKQFMEDNGYKLTPQGKSLAISELESLAESDTYPADLVISLTTAITTL